MNHMAIPTPASTPRAKAATPIITRTGPGSRLAMPQHSTPQRHRRASGAWPPCRATHMRWPNAASSLFRTWLLRFQIGLRRRRATDISPGVRVDFLIWNFAHPGFVRLVEFLLILYVVIGLGFFVPSQRYAGLCTPGRTPGSPAPGSELGVARGYHRHDHHRRHQASHGAAPFALILERSPRPPPLMPPIAPAGPSASPRRLLDLRPEGGRSVAADVRSWPIVADGARRSLECSRFRLHRLHSRSL
jgi:hypothetical protein